MNDFSSIANTIRDSSIKLIFKKLSKHNEPVIKSGLQELINIIPTLDYDTVFCEIVGHCCVAFDHFLYEDNVEIRSLCLNMIAQVITKLKRDIVGYATLIFPTLLVYCYDCDIGKEAESVLLISFPTEEKRIQLLSKMQYDICEKVSSTLTSVKKKLLTNSSIGRVSASCLSLTIKMIEISGKKSGFVSELLTKIDVFDSIMKIDNNDTSMKFALSATPILRRVVYKFLEYEEDETQPLKILNFLICEDSDSSQICLLSLISKFIKSGELKTEDVCRVFENAIHLYLNPPDSLKPFLELISDDRYLLDLVQKIVLLDDSQKLFDLLISLIHEKEIILPLFGRMVAAEPESNFLNTCPLTVFEFIKNDPKIDEMMSANADEDRCLEFIQYLNEERAEKWLRTRQTVSSKCILTILKTFSAETIRKIWDNYEKIPFSDKLYLIDILCLYLEKDEIPKFVKYNNEKVPELLRKWSRDFSILNCEELIENSLTYLDEDPSLIKYFSQISPESNTVNDVLTAVVANTLNNGEKNIDSSVFDYFNPTDDFLKTFLLSPTSSSTLTPDHALKEPLIKAIPTFIAAIDHSIILNPVINFVTKCNLDPLVIEYDILSYPHFTAKFYGHFGFELLSPDVFCKFLEAYLLSKVPWLPVFLYIQNIDWQIIPDLLWNFLERKSDYATICHTLNLPLALSCVCAASNATIDQLPIDFLTLNAMPTVEPPRDCLQNSSNKEDAGITVLKMEWLQLRPKAPDFHSTDNYYVTLRQTIAYLRFFLPTLMEFEPVYELLFNSLHECDDRLIFFFCVRIISLISQTNATIPSLALLEELIVYVVKFAPFTTVIENELIGAFSIAKRLNSDEFNIIATKCAPLFASSLSTQLVRLILPLFQYFNSWNLLEDNLNGRLDLKDILSWNFVTSALFMMPSAVRVGYTRQYAKAVPSLLANLSPKSRQFEQLATAFPVTFSRWVRGLGQDNSNKNNNNNYNDTNNSIDDNNSSDKNNNNNKNRNDNGSDNNNEVMRQKVLTEMRLKVTRNVFKSIVKDVIRLKLENAVVHSNVNSLTLGVVYKEDELSMPIALEIKFPDTFPAEDMKVQTDIGNRQLNQMCDEKIATAIGATESVECGVKAWHGFVIQRVKDADPCPICYSYFAQDTKQAPSVKCGTCGQTFHKGCLRKWFEKCLFKTCPACASRWKEAQK